MNPMHQFKARSLRGEEIDFSRYEGKVLLLVNTASKCGFTPQLAGLEKLYEELESEGLIVLGFPCNQFAGQEPGGAKEIEETCMINYGVSFPMFEKIEVNGENAHPIFKHLTEALPGIMGKRIKWNFTKFLIGRDGTPLKRFAPTTTPEALRPQILEALGNGA